jgi:hypothetical protein
MRMRRMAVSASRGDLVVPFARLEAIRVRVCAACVAHACCLCAATVWFCLTVCIVGDLVFGCLQSLGWGHTPQCDACD